MNKEFERNMRHISRNGGTKMARTMTKIKAHQNSYEIHKQAVAQNLYMYYFIKEIFGKPVKRRLFKKWHHRYIRERNRDIKRLGKQNQEKNKIYFGRVVYTYYFQGENKLEFFLGNGWGLVFTCKPRCRNSRPLPLNYAKERMMDYYGAYHE